MTQPKTSTQVLDVAIGAAVGLLVGGLLGLSATPVVGAVVSGLVALLSAFLGLQGAKAAYVKELRILGFAVACAGAVPLALLARTHDVFSRPLADEVERWRAAGFDEAQARAAVLYTRAGLVPEGVKPAENPEGGRRPADSVLFTGPAVAACAELRRDRFASVDEWANAWRLQGGPWQRASQELSALGPGDREQALKSAWSLTCEGAR